MPHLPRAGRFATLVGVALAILFFLPLLDPRQVLVARDVFFLHLPLRTAFAALAHMGGLPDWNPTLHGGQPLLSNPQYAAFYPPSWLGVLVGPAWAMGLLVPLHFAIAFAGAWAYARQLGCGRPAALVGAVSFAAGGAFVGLVSLFNLLCGLAWMPWTLRFADLAAKRRGSGWVRPAALAAGCLALSVVAEGQVAPLLTIVTLAALHLPAILRRPVVVPRLVAVGLLAGLLAAVQMVPTAARIPDSPRARPLDWSVATNWSAPPQRLVEALVPRLYGDATRDEENYHFAWQLHDRNYPFIVSIYQGLLPALLGLVAVCLPIPHRGAWATLVAAGVALGLGRHDPLYRWLYGWLPPLDQIRYPEKFLLLSLFAMSFAGALAWDRLLRGAAPRSGRATAIAAAGGLLLAIAGLWAVTWIDVGAVEAWIRRGSGMPPSPRTLAVGVAFLRIEGAIALLVAGATFALLALAGPPRRRRLLGTVAVLLVAGELLHYQQRHYRVAPAADILRPPPLVERVLAAGGRVFTNVAFDTRPEVSLRVGKPGFYQLRARLARLDPYSGAIWGVRYALHEDFDLMLTDWGRFALRAIHDDWPKDPQRARRLLAAWSVRSLVLRRSVDDIVAEAKRTNRLPDPATVEPNPGALPFERTVAAATFHRTRDAALAAARAGGYDLAKGEDLVDPDAADGVRRSYAPAELGRVLDLGDRVVVPVRAAGTALLVSSRTYDRRWTASSEVGTLAVWPTGIGQLAVEVPAGEHLVVLEYRDPWVRVGGAVSLATLLGLLLVVRRVPA